ncbi:MAG: anhydro-N-acetylmuramic acid kinase [Crocinitomicaceae bacterium]|nr:anhydro-N-acetylmuramic acid kinase [Crocinitomicaceae bacterium]|tara:strand:- start:189 stop:1250 length:1062 start_codon:yes stop_codon:yes gene_type:complete
MNKYYVVGIMSGTSLDGLDVVWSKLSFNKAWFYEIIDGKTYEYSPRWKNELKNAYKIKARDLVFLDKKLGNYIGEKINDFLKEKKIQKSQIDLISSHGHTLFHEPENNLTKQIGNGAYICSKTKIKTVSDFRTIDVAFGGQGAPLVPIGDQLLFGSCKGCLNLGGIANISYNLKEKRVAGDINFANMISNYLSNKIGHSFDKDGELAKQGKIDENLILKLEELDFFKKEFPKSLGVEDFNHWYKPLFEECKSSINDQLYTSGTHLCRTIKNIFNFDSDDRLLITGGGAYNKFWINKIKELKIKTVIPETKLIDFKEALIFSLLGVLKLRSEINILASVTGSSKDLSAGVIHKP